MEPINSPRGERWALKLRPNYALAHADLGKVFSRMGQPEQANVHLKEAVQLDPNLAKQVNLETAIGAKYVSNIAVQHKQRIEEARAAVATKALERARLGKLLSRQGQTEQAMIQFKEALRLNPNLPFCEVNFRQ